MMTSVPCMLLRGGTSKGAYFLKEQLPADPAARDRLLLRAMGSPDARQIDGLGGAHPLTSKVAVVSASRADPGAVDYLFLQIGVETPTVSRTQNCGNLLAGVGAFAIERGLVVAAEGYTTVRINLVNTGGTATAVVSTPGRVVSYEGEQEIAGVPGRSARVLLEFADTAGSSCGALLPTGHAVDVIGGVRASCIDNGMPTVVIDARSMSLTGTESPAALEADTALCRRIEEIRRAAGILMGLGDVSEMTTPKVSLVSAARAGGTLATRTFIPWHVHDALGVLCAASIGAAWQLPESALDTVSGSGVRTPLLRMEHPTGFIDIEVDVTVDTTGPRVLRTANVRTARKIFDGLVFVPGG
ncbi:4-oxalomesaconate tautomerase [Specibacter sp. RAF43]|uniref:4-oxalomesaconate tautomerase n=1 Tax=Specibacter sp. RAF43 TaxID=3233057 RepID=UPI003F9BE9B3